MIKKTAVRWADWMVENGAPEDQREIYRYGAECVINEVTSDLFLLILAFYLNRMWEMAVWIALFTVLRVNLGGFHASSHGKCVVCSTVAGVVCTFLYPVFTGNLFLSAICAGAGMGVVLGIAPVVHKNHPVSETKRASSRRWAIKLSLIEIAGSAAGYLLSPALSAMMLTSFLSAVVIGILGYLHNLGN